MKKRKNITTLIIFLAIIIIAVLSFTIQPKNETTQELAQCIGENSILYTQLGCHACENQEELFGENYQYLTVVDCFYNSQECIDKEISGTPTWEINEELYLGVQSIEELKELTNC